MIFRLSFAGQITKCEIKQIGDKTLAEMSLCKKFKGRNGAEDTWTWVKVGLWDPAPFQLPKLIKGSFVAGSGEFQLRSFDGKDGSKQVSAEVRCGSFDVEVSDGAPREAQPQAAPVTTVQPVAAAPQKRVANPMADDEPAF